MTNESSGSRPQSWLLVLLLFGVTSAVESAGFGHVMAFLPLYLGHVGMPDADISRWVGLLTGLLFVLGLPLVPFWGAWADKYSRKLIITRSALVEAVVFTGLALSRNRWEIAVSLLLVGFQLGNTGVMLSLLRDVTPERRVGFAISLLGAIAAGGTAAGPAIGGWLVDNTSLSLSGLFAVDAILSLAAAAMLTIGLRDVRIGQTVTDSVTTLARRAITGVVTTPVTLRLFGSFVLFYLGWFMARPYLPLFVERVHPSETGLAAAVGLVVGTAALLGSLAAPLAGALGDRLGFRRMQDFTTVATILCILAIPAAHSVLTLAVTAALLFAATSTYMALFFALLATVVPEAQRSATLNLAMLPIYLAGIVGPALGSEVVRGGLGWVVVTGAVFVFGALVLQRLFLSTMPLPDELPGVPEPAT